LAKQEFDKSLAIDRAIKNYQGILQTETIMRQFNL